MKFTHKIATGAVALMSAAALSGATAPAVAVSQTKAPQGAAPKATETTVRLAAAACPSKWKKAGGVPRKWSTAKDTQCSIFGRPGYKAVYQWSAVRGTPCIKVLGFDSKGRDKWHNAGCGKKGAIKVPWGNVAANKIIKIKGASLLEWR
ncbi:MULTISPECIES: hypothetical protein [unclassified Streptomyces]|uniref:hypothetical protein n=1 Tax=unclassified Streptomyces TaxID=2593676 RepID=UPI000CD4B285|nr:MULTISPECIES: hypothetical protein [unclassified Streptomyces]MCI4040700.1 hypothetical protein [Streptomyces sp. TRM75563]